MMTKDGDITKTYFMGKARYGVVVQFPDMQIIYFPDDKVGCGIENFGEYLGNIVTDPKLFKFYFGGVKR